MSMMKRGNPQGIRQYLRCISSLCITRNTAYYFTLYEYSEIRERISGKYYIMKRLRKEWNFDDAKSLKLTLGYLLDEGNRVEYNNIRHFLSALSEEDRIRYINALTSEDSNYSKYAIVNHYLKSLPIDGIAAYDYAQYIYLCRTGYTLGLLYKKEAMIKMMTAANRLQQCYSSWPEFITAFMAGKQFVASDRRAAFSKQDEAFITKLLSAKNSPLQHLDWNMYIGSFEESFKYRDPLIKV